MKSIALCVAIGSALAATSAHAGVYADDLSKCLVRKASPADQTAFIQWFYAALSASPAVKSMSMISEAQRAQYNKVAAQLFIRLLTSDCHAESVAALKYEGSSALEAGFQVFGQVASRGLMSNPEVEKQMQGFGTYFDEQKFKALNKEAGLPDTTPTATPTGK